MVIIMLMKCIKGSISCDGVLAKRGETFEVRDEAGKILIKSRFAVEIGSASSDVTDDTVEAATDNVDDKEQTESEVYIDASGEATREYKGVMQHKHEDCNYWHPIDRTHETTDDE